MRIAYGVMGYGRGHAMRTLSVLPALAEEHEITMFAGGDAYEVLAPLYPTVRIPTLGYAYDDNGDHSTLRTLARNLSCVGDLLLGGSGSERVEREFRQRGIQLVISDSEAWCHRAAQNLKLPRISFDHVGIIAYCKPHFPPDLWLTGMRDAAVYRGLMGEPERILISSFYPAQPRKPTTRIVGPVLRDAVHRLQPTDGDFLLAYFNKGEHQFLPHVERALRLLDRPVVIYGTPLRGRSDNLDFRAPSNDGFLRDLAACQAVISTSGNNLIGEALHFGKPIFTMPEPAFEQRLNAYMVERMGIGMRADLATLTPSDIDRFLGNDDYYRFNIAEYRGDGRREAIEALQRFIGELVRAPSRSGTRQQRAVGPDMQTSAA